MNSQPNYILIVAILLLFCYCISGKEKRRVLRDYTAKIDTVGYSELSFIEKQLLYEYIWLNHEQNWSNGNAWQLAVVSVLKDFSVVKFRQLNSDLLSQARDNRGMMESIIGEEAVTLLEQMESRGMEVAL